MVRSILALVAFCAAYGGAHEPITEFTPGTYLGSGHFIRTTGEEGSYSSNAEILSDEIHLSLNLDGNLFVYNLYFDFANLGFFTVSATEYTQSGVTLDHEGHGYCSNVQCHYAFDLENRYIEETITFGHEDSIYKIGSMRYLDSDSETQTMSWHEVLLLLQEDEEEEEEEDAE